MLALKVARKKKKINKVPLVINHFGLSGFSYCFFLDQSHKRQSGNCIVGSLDGCNFGLIGLYGPSLIGLVY